MSLLCSFPKETSKTEIWKMKWALFGKREKKRKEA
jgi:hypothetical protein